MYLLYWIKMVSKKNKFYLITIDMDWAPDWMINYVLDIIGKNKKPIHWFLTNKSKLLKKRKLKNFYYGLHPNVGNDIMSIPNIEKKILKLKKILPKSELIRTHGNVTSTNLSIVLSKFFKYDFSNFQPRNTKLRAHAVSWYDRPILNISYNWEDSFEATKKVKYFDIKENFFKKNDFIIFNFHPVHIYLNTYNYGLYSKLKKKLGKIQGWLPEDLEKHRNKKPVGSEIFFRQLLNLKDSFFKSVYDVEID